mgnify:FL=1
MNESDDWSLRSTPSFQWMVFHPGTGSQPDIWYLDEMHKMLTFWCDKRNLYDNAGRPFSIGFVNIWSIIGLAGVLRNMIIYQAAKQYPCNPRICSNAGHIKYGSCKSKESSTPTTIPNSVVFDHRNRGIEVYAYSLSYPDNNLLLYRLLYKLHRI